MKKRIIAVLLAIVMVVSLVPAMAITAYAAPAGCGPRKMEGGQRDFGWPVPDNYGISSCYLDGANAGDPDGRNHYAIDIPANMGTRVVASYAGTVEAIYSGCSHNYSKNYSCCNDGFGNFVVLKHTYKLADGSTKTLYSRYSHLTNVSVSVGQTVSKGTLVGTVGSTGYSQGFHLDFQILQNNWNSRAAWIPMSMSFWSFPPMFFAILPQTAAASVPMPAAAICTSSMSRNCTKLLVILTNALITPVTRTSGLPAQPIYGTFPAPMRFPMRLKLWVKPQPDIL